MSESMEEAHETIHEHAGHADPWARCVAVLVSIIAAALALVDIGGKASQNAYMTCCRTTGRFIRPRTFARVVRTSEADLLASLRNAAAPAVQTRLKQARDLAAKLRD